MKGVTTGNPNAGHTGCRQEIRQNNGMGKKNELKNEAMERLWPPSRRQGFDVNPGTV